MLGTPRKAGHASTSTSLDMASKAKASATGTVLRSCDSACIQTITNPLIFTSQLKHTLSQAFILSQANRGLIALIVRRARSVSVFVWNLFEKLYQHSKHNSQEWTSCFSYSLPIPSLQIRLARRFSTAILYQTILSPHQTAVLCSNGQRVNLFLSSRFMKDTMQSIACVAWGCWKRHVKQAMPQLPPLWTWHPKPKPIPRTRVSNLLWARVDTFACALSD